MTTDVVVGSFHVLAFAVYIGGLFYGEAVIEPAANAIAPAQGTVVRRKAGDRQVIIAWVSLIVILITGIIRLDRLGMLAFPGTFFLEPNVASGDYGQTVIAMLIGWCVLVALGLVMTFALRPILIGKIDPTLSAPQQQQRQERMMQAARWMGIVLRADLVVVVVIAVLGVSLRYGGLL